MWFKSTRDSKSLQNFDSNQLTTQETFQNLDSNQLMTQWCYSFPVSFDIFWAFNFTVDLVWPFWGFQLKSSIHMNFLRLSTQVPSRQTDLNQLMTQAVSRSLEAIKLMTQRLSRNWLRINSRLKWIPRSWHFRSTHDSKRFPIFLFKSIHDSSKRHLILIRLMIRLWVIPMSGWRFAMDGYSCR